MRPTKISLAGFPGVRELGPEDVLHLPCDALVPAALENALTVDSAAAVRARIVVEAANGPTTPGGDRLLGERGIPVVPGLRRGRGDGGGPAGHDPAAGR